MAYRDPAAAARERVRQAREEVERHEERITPTLLQQLSREARAELEARADAVIEALPEQLEGLDRATLLAALPLLAAYGEALTKAIAEAPRLAKRYNRLPRTFPKRLRTSFFYQYLDIYSPKTAAMRRALHRRIRALDPDANLISARRRYDDEVVEPYLAEAEFTVEHAPLRLQVLARHGNTANSSGVATITARAYALFVKTRPSTPTLRVELQGVDDRLLKWLRLRSEPEIGHAAFNDAFFIHGSASDALRVLRPEVYEPLLELAHNREVELTIADGFARLEWLDAGGADRLRSAVATMVGVRNTPPVRLLRRRRPRAGR